MNSKLFLFIIGFTLVLSGCAGGADETQQGNQLSGTVQIDGSSTVFPITEAVAEEFQRANPSVKVPVGISGTGGGFQKFCAGEIDIADASRPIKQAEFDACAQKGIEYIELPVAYDGLAVVVNPMNNWVDHITAAELKTLWEPGAQGKVTKWNQVRAGWPDREIHLFGAGVDSGTYDYFTEAINGATGASRGDYTSSEDDNVLVQGVALDELALGYFGLAYYEENQDKLKLINVDDEKADNGVGPIAPTMETVMDGTYQPLARPIFIYVRKDALDRPEVAAFVDFYIQNAPTLVKEVKYIPLPERAYTLASTRVQNRTTGSMFAGKGAQVGVRIEQLMEAE